MKTNRRVFVRWRNGKREKILLPPAPPICRSLKHHLQSCKSPDNVSPPKTDSKPAGKSKIGPAEKDTQNTETRRPAFTMTKEKIQKIVSKMSDWEQDIRNKTPAKASEKHIFVCKSLLNLISETKQSIIEHQNVTPQLVARLRQIDQWMKIFNDALKLGHRRRDYLKNVERSLKEKEMEPIEAELVEENPNDDEELSDEEDWSETTVDGHEDFKSTNVKSGSKLNFFINNEDRIKKMNGLLHEELSFLNKSGIKLKMTSISEEWLHFEMPRNSGFPKPPIRLKFSVASSYKPHIISASSVVFKGIKSHGACENMMAKVMDRLFRSEYGPDKHFGVRELTFAFADRKSVV